MASFKKKKHLTMAEEKCAKCMLHEIDRNLTEKSFKRQIKLLNSKIDFVRFSNPPPPFSDVVLVAANEVLTNPNSVSAHKAVLASRSPVFKAMLETEMEESRTGTIKISDVSNNTLRSFVNYMYTGDAYLNEQLASDLLILADKYEVEHMKTTCGNFLVSKLKLENAFARLELAHQHNAKHLQESALSILTGNMNDLIKTEEYARMVEKDPRLIVKVYEAYLSKQVKAASKSN